MKIGELAERTGLPHSRIRYYERIGLLRTVERLPNGYRIYAPESEIILKLIRIAQRAGFTLEEMHALVPTDLAHWDHTLLTQHLTRKIGEIEAQEARLAASKAQLVAILTGIENRPEDIDCATNAVRVLSLVMPVDLDEISLRINGK